MYVCGFHAIEILQRRKESFARNFYGCTYTSKITPVSYSYAQAIMHRVCSRPWNRTTNKPMSFWGSDFSNGLFGYTHIHTPCTYTSKITPVSYSYAQAIMHRVRSRPWNRATNKPMSFWGSDFSNGLLGDGIALWIRFLWQSSAVFLIMFLINLAPFILYVQRDGISADMRNGQGILAVPTLGNLFNKCV